MKKLLIILFTLFLCHNLMAQTTNNDEYQYVPIPDNHIWSVNMFKYKTCGDTIINDKNYLKVYQQYEREPFDFDLSKAEYYCSLRNDTLNKRVYVVYPYNWPYGVYEYIAHYDYLFLFYTTDTTEFLL